MIGAKTLHLRFDKVVGFIRIYDGTRYSVLFRPEKYDAIYNGTGFLMNHNIVISCTIFLIFMQKSKFFHMVLYLEKKTLTLCNFIIFIKPIFN